MKQQFLIFITVFLSLSGVCTANPEYGKAAQVQKTTLEQKVDSLVALQLRETHPGGVIAVISPGKILLQKAYGLMDAENSAENDERTLFDIASLAKQFTAFAIFQLEKEGKLSLEDYITKYLQGLPDYGDDITIRQLLQHTSGIASTDVLRLFAGLSLDEKWSQSDEIFLIKSFPQLNFKPNARHVYSNAGYSLLAEIVESVSNLEFPDFMQRKVFAPLGMKESHVFTGSERLPDNMSSGYRIENGKAGKVSSVADYSYGAGNMHSNLEDMIKWAQSILSGSADRKSYLEMISRPCNTLDNGDSIYYTYGFYVRKYKGLRTVEHSGGIPGFRNQFIIFPDEKIAMILMFNNESFNTRRLALGIADFLFYDKLVEEPARERVEIETDTTLLRSYEGKYRMPDGMEMSFVLAEGVFWLMLPGDEKFQLFAESGSKFFLKAFDAQCSFVKNENAEANEMIWHQGGSDYSAVRVVDTEPLTLEELSSFADLYIQKDLQATYPVVFSDGRLILQTPETFKKYLGFDEVFLNHVNGDKFLTDKLGMLEFTRNEKDEVTGFILADVGRLQNLVFTRMIQPVK